MSREATLHELRKVFTGSASEVEVPTEIVDSARYALKTVVDEAAEYGFTEADVVRAMFRPVFRKEKGCDCYTCKARRIEMGIEQPEDANGVHV